jgi:predicted MFS family arabinose efflux permease
MTGIVLTGKGLGNVILPLITSQLIPIYGWRTSYIIVGIISLVLVISAAQFLRRDPSQIGQLPYGASEEDEQKSNSGERGLSLHEAIHTKQFWMLSMICFCVGFLTFTIMVHIVPHATGLGISATAAATILAIIGGASISGRVVLGAAADRISPKAALTGGFVLLSGALFWLTVARGTSMLYLFAAIFGSAYGFDAPMTPMVAGLFGLKSLGATMGAIGISYTIGAAIGPVLAGYIFDITSSYQLAFFVCGVLSIVALILVLLVRPIVQKKQ